MNNSLHEVELAKAQIEQKEPFVVGCCILESTELQTLIIIYYNFFTNLYEVNKSQELERDTDSLYVAFVEDCKTVSDLQWKQSGSACGWKIALIVSLLMQLEFYYLRICFGKHKKPDQRQPGLFKEELKFPGKLCYFFKTYCCYDTTFNKFRVNSKGLNGRIVEQSGESTLEDGRKVLDDGVNFTSTNRNFRTRDHTVATYEQTKTGLLFFHP